jgi:hypothetical protein
MTVEIEVTRTADASDLAKALAAQGFVADTEGAGCIRVEAESCAHIEHALEDWTAARGLPFVPQVVDDQHVVLAPPGS